MADELSHEAYEAQLRDMAASWDCNAFDMPEQARSALENHCTIVVEHATKTGMAVTVDALWWFGAGGQADSILNHGVPWQQIPPMRNGAYIAAACLASMMLAGRLPLPQAKLIVPDHIDGD